VARPSPAWSAHGSCRGPGAHSHSQFSIQTMPSAVLLTTSQQSGANSVLASPEGDSVSDLGATELAVKGSTYPQRWGREALGKASLVRSRAYHRGAPEHPVRLAGPAKQCALCHARLDGQLVRAIFEQPCYCPETAARAACDARAVIIAGNITGGHSLVGWLWKSTGDFDVCAGKGPPAASGEGRGSRGPPVLRQGRRRLGANGRCSPAAT
jgi:hypothetical protein